MHAHTQSALTYPLWGVICVKMTMTMYITRVHSYARYNMHVNMHMHVTICISTCICTLQYACQHPYARYNNYVQHAYEHYNMHACQHAYARYNMHACNMHMHTTTCIYLLYTFTVLYCMHGMSIIIPPAA